MSDITVRTADPAEIPDLLAFWARAAEGASITDDPAGVARLLERDPQALIVAELDGALAGTVIAGFDGWRCHLYRLAVAPELRRRGIGGALVAAAEERFAALGAGGPTPWCWSATRRAGPPGRRRGTTGRTSGGAG
ncbi:hypothetical protein GCM10025734_14240 [Kitasatospora paranensis]